MNACKEQLSAMSEGYCRLWNDWEQNRIDRDIEANRKADAEFLLALPPGTEVRAEQLSHEFIFGAHIFNFDQLGTHERNEKYKALYGTLFNSATIAFYWYPFEPEEGNMRFASSECDSEDFWNRCEHPENQPHWRRPATDRVVEFCEKKGIRRHGHPLVWGNRTWQYPRWLLDKLPKESLIQLMTDDRCGANFWTKSPAEIAALLPDFTREMNAAVERRIRTIAAHYGDRVQSWDVCNESATDFALGRHIPGDAFCKSVYGPMPGDYAFNAFRIAADAFPKNVKLNINDYNLDECYPDQTDDLRRRGSRIDIMGAQMHLFNPRTCLDIADGKSSVQSPAEVRAAMDHIGRAGLPIHLSEITITAPRNDERGQTIQAVITRNLYRLWFSLKPMMGITWWNVVDDCGAPGEPSVSGLFSRNMEPKKAYFSLENLILREWRTNLELKADSSGAVSFRGFRGEYRLSWKDSAGRTQSVIRTVK